MAGSGDRVLDILSWLVDRPGGATLKDISDATGISRATAYRTTSGLVESGWLLAAGTPTRFTPSRRVAQLGLAVLKHDRVREAVLPNAIDIARALACVCMLAFFERGDVVYTDAIEVYGERVMPTPSGVRALAYTTACGKVLLSHQPEAIIQEALSNLPDALTNGQPLDAATLRSELKLTRERGFALSNREFRQTASGVAVPVFGRDGEVAAAIGIHADTGADEEFISRVLPTALEFARKASMELGHRSARRTRLS